MGNKINTHVEDFFQLLKLIAQREAIMYESEEFFQTNNFKRYFKLYSSLFDDVYEKFQKLCNHKSFDEDDIDDRFNGNCICSLSECSGLMFCDGILLKGEKYVDSFLAASVDKARGMVTFDFIEFVTFTTDLTEIVYVS